MEKRPFNEGLISCPAMFLTLRTSVFSKLAQAEIASYEGLKI